MNILNELYPELQKAAKQLNIGDVAAVQLLYKNLCDFLLVTPENVKKEKDGLKRKQTEQENTLYIQLITEYFKKQQIFNPQKLDGSWENSKERISIIQYKIQNTKENTD